MSDEEKFAAVMKDGDIIISKNPVLTQLLMNETPVDHPVRRILGATGHLETVMMANLEQARIDLVNGRILTEEEGTRIELEPLYDSSTAVTATIDLMARKEPHAH